MNYSRFLNRIALARKPNPIRVLAGILQQGPPSMISMAGGNPNSDNFPLTEATLTLRDGSKLLVDEDSMRQALQYSATPGITDLFEWVKGLQDRIHKPPTLNASDMEGKLDFLITNGSQDGICKALEAMTIGGDNVLMEIPCYVGTLSIVRPRGANILPVNVDHNGADPEHLKKQLSKWKPSDAKDPDSKIPKVFYTIPNCSNPTGSGQTEDRKKAIYELAQEYDLMILEDDPYFYVQFQRPYVPSYLSMDVDGRVVRFDSFSKLISSGIRLGFVSGPQPVIQKLGLHMQTSVMHASGLSQVVMLRVLQKMGYFGFENHAAKVAKFYEEKRDQCLEAANKHLTGLAEWSVPTGGMFLWMKLVNVEDSYRLITVKAREKEVLFVPGSAFMLDDTQPCPYVRVSYSNVTAEQMDKAFERLAALIREEQKS